MQCNPEVNTICTDQIRSNQIIADILLMLLAEQQQKSLIPAQTHCRRRF